MLLIARKAINYKGLSEMNTEAKHRSGRESYRERRRRQRQHNCSLCGGGQDFCWRCRCGFAICQECMEENFWGMSCNGITWQCPDCGGYNGFGNQ